MCDLVRLVEAGLQVHLDKVDRPVELTKWTGPVVAQEGEPLLGQARRVQADRASSQTGVLANGVLQHGHERPEQQVHLLHAPLAGVVAEDGPQSRPLGHEAQPERTKPFFLWLE